jgi:hypothetical protein
VSPYLVWHAPAGRVLSRSYTSSTGPRLHVWKRAACLAVAIALLALPVSVLAEDVESSDPVTAVLVAPVAGPAYAWDGRLAASYSAPVAGPAYAWDGRLAASYSAPVAGPAYAWDGRLAASYSAPVAALSERAALTIVLASAGAGAAVPATWAAEAPGLEPAALTEKLHEHFLVEHSSELNRSHFDPAVLAELLGDHFQIEHASEARG